MSKERKELRAALEIVVDDLDECLVRQPGLYYHVADGYVKAAAERDAVKLDLDEAVASADKQLRAWAATKQEKITNDAVERQIALQPAIKELQRHYLDARANAEQWQVLKEAYQQRSFMLRELVAIQLANMQNLSLERGAHKDARDLADANRRAVLVKRQRLKSI